MNKKEALKALHKMKGVTDYRKGDKPQDVGVLVVQHCKGDSKAVRDLLGRFQGVYANPKRYEELSKGFCDEDGCFHGLPGLQEPHETIPFAPYTEWYDPRVVVFLDKPVCPKSKKGKHLYITDIEEDKFEVRGGEEDGEITNYYVVITRTQVANVFVQANDRGEALEKALDEALHGTNPPEYEGDGLIEAEYEDVYLDEKEKEDDC